MPVYVESVTQPSPQDLTDLAKIYADAPEWLLTPYTSAEALIEAALADGSLIAGRFNDRLLGAPCCSAATMPGACHTCAYASSPASAASAAGCWRRPSVRPAKPASRCAWQLRLGTWKPAPWPRVHICRWIRSRLGC